MAFRSTPGDGSGGGTAVGSAGTVGVVKLEYAVSPVVSVDCVLHCLVFFHRVNRNPRIPFVIQNAPFVIQNPVL